MSGVETLCPIKIRKTFKEQYFSEERELEREREREKRGSSKSSMIKHIAVTYAV